MVPDNDTPQGVDCSSLEGLYEAALILLANSHKVADWTNGDEQTDVELGGKPTPSIRKLIALLNGIAGIATATTPGAVMPDGVTTEVDAQGKLSAIKATLQSFGVIKPDGVTTTVNDAGLLSALGGNLLTNDEIWITESGTFNVPVTGWYEVLCINGGSAGSNPGTYAAGGDSGAFDSRLLYLSAGEDISVTIGAGGAPNAGIVGGKTTFGEFSPNSRKRLHGEVVGLPLPTPSTYDIAAVGAGVGGGSWSWDVASDPNAENLNGTWYGAGGSSRRVQQSGNSMNGTHLGKGYQGAIRLRFWNPAKANGPAAAIEKAE